MSAFNENDLRHSASLLYKLNSIENKVSQEISDLEIGTRNLWAKKYMMDWNETYAGCATKGSDEYGEYIQIKEYNIWKYIANQATKTDIFNGKITFEPNKQYCFKVKWRNASTDPTKWGIGFYINYTDGTQVAFSTSGTVGNTSEPSIKMLKTDSTKTVACIGMTYNYSTAQTRIYEIQLVQATKQPNDWLVAPEDLMDYTDTTIDNLEIGGTNIIYGTINPSTIVSNSVKSTTAYNNAEVIECQYSATGANTGTSTKYKDFTISSSNFGKLKNNQDYTLSFDIKGTVAHATADQKIVNHFYNTNQGSTGYLVAKLKTSWGYSSTAGDGLNYLPITTSWERISITFTTTSTVTNANVIPSIIICRIRETYTGIISIANIQLEEGNKATSWSPAPEDKQDKITGTNQSVLYIGTDGVTSDTNLKYNASNGTLSTLKINVGGGALFTYNSTTGCLEISV